MDFDRHQRLVRLASTVLLNVATIVAIIAVVLGRSRYFEFRFFSPNASHALTIDCFGWQAFTVDENGWGQIFEFVVELESHNLWEPYDSNDRSLLFGGLLLRQLPGQAPSLIGAKHWFAVSLLMGFQVFHHRRRLFRYF